jgi:hypothetical protein
VNPDRLICGLATLFGTMAHSGVFWTARMFEGWLRSPITALPLRVNHSMLAIERGGLVITNVGTCRMFATVKEPRDGLLTLAEIDDGPWGDALLEDVRRHMGQEWMPTYGLSIACQEIPGEMVLPFEVSLTTRPSFSYAKVLAIGEAAMTTWNLLTEAPATAKRPCPTWSGHDPAVLHLPHLRRLGFGARRRRRIRLAV